MKKLQYSKLIITFFAHIFTGVLYGSFFGLMLKESGAPQWVSVIIQLLTIAIVTVVAYEEEVKRHYPFLKAVGVNFFGFVLWFVVLMTKVYLLEIVAFVVVLFMIRYRCKNCVEYKRFTFE